MTLLHKAASITLAATFALSACAPKQDPLDPDQCPDVNYSLTALKDNKLLGSIPEIDNAVSAGSWSAASRPASVAAGPRRTLRSFGSPRR